MEVAQQFHAQTLDELGRYTPTQVLWRVLADPNRYIEGNSYQHSIMLTLIWHGKPPWVVPPNRDVLLDISELPGVLSRLVDLVSEVHSRVVDSLTTWPGDLVQLVNSYLDGPRVYCEQYLLDQKQTALKERDNHRFLNQYKTYVEPRLDFEAVEPQQPTTKRQCLGVGSFTDPIVIP
jgi:hypothetical protein